MASGIQRRISLRISSALAAAALASFAGCSSDKSDPPPPASQPGPAPTPAAAPVSFQLSSQSLGLSTGQAMKLRIQIFAADGGKVAAKPESEHLFDATAQQSVFQVPAVEPGPKVALLALLAADGSLYAEDLLRLVVNGSPVTAPPVTLAVVRTARRDLGVRLTVQVSTSTSAPPTTYLDVKPILDKHCIHCHGGATPSATLDLSSFEFKYGAGARLTQRQIVDDLIGQMKSAVTDPANGMPPASDAGNSPVSAAEIALFKSWEAGGLLKAPAADDSADLAQKIELSWSQGSAALGKTELTRAPGAQALFVGTAPALSVNKAYDFNVTVLTADGSILYTAVIKGYMVDQQHPLEQLLTVPYQQPDVTIPVVIQP